MTRERASIFDEDDLGAGGFEPTPAHRPDAKAVRAAAEAAGFTARDPAPSQAEAPPSERPRRGRLKTGRNQQLNIKLTQATLTRFLDLADRLGVSQAEAFEQAVAALREKLDGPD